ncbi:Alpha/beta hydrolase [Desulfarculales bacterium]
MEHPSPYPRPLPAGFGQRWLEQDFGWLRLVAGGRGPALFLVHGLGGSAEDFYDLAPLLAQRFTCLLPTLPGFGLSHKPDAPYGVTWFAGQMASLAGALGISRAHWLGHSLGGQIVLVLAREHPALARRVVALCPSGGQPPLSRSQKCLHALMSWGDRLRWYHPGMLRLAAAYIFKQPLWGQPTWPDFPQFAQRLQAQWAGPERPLRERAIIRAARGMLELPLAGQLHNLSTPVLLLEGLGDHVTPAEQIQRLWESLPPGQMRARLPGGHMVPYLAPQELAQQVLDFLESGR